MVAMQGPSRLRLARFDLIGIYLNRYQTLQVESPRLLGMDLPLAHSR